MPTTFSPSITARESVPAPFAPRPRHRNASSPARSGAERDPWRTIESAPRDDVPVDLWATRGIRLTDCWWDAEGACWMRWDADPFAGAGLIKVLEEVSYWRPITGPQDSPAMAGWISTKTRLPEDRSAPYQVIAACHKELGGNYKGLAKRGFYQDWVVRRWPQNFLAWMEAPAHIPLTNSGGRLLPEKD